MRSYFAGLIISLLFLLLPLLLPTTASAQNFACAQASVLDPCLLDDAEYACANDAYTRAAAVAYCSTMSGTDCYPVSSYVSCSVIPTPTLIPTPTTDPAVTPTSGPTPTPTLIPTPTTSVCVPQPCDTTLNFECPGTTVCCPDVINCPSPDPTTLPYCHNHGQCQVDWDGMGYYDGGSAGVFDRYQGCTKNNCNVAGIPDEVATCGLDASASVCDYDVPYLCDTPDGVNTGVQSALGCIPFKSSSFTIALLNWSIGISGGIGFLLLVIASAQIATASGDPKKLQAAQNLLFSTLAGISLIVLSIILLNFIGVNVLGLHNFGFNLNP